MPDISNVHIDVALTNLSRAVTNDDLVADKIFPIAPVKKDSDKFFIYDKSNLRVDQTRWAPKAQVKEVNWEVTTDTYRTERHGLGELIEDDEKDNQDQPLDLESDTTEQLTEKLLLRREKNLAAILTNAANFDADAQPSLGAAARWDNYASATSDPNVDIQLARKTIYKKTFMRPNTVILPYEVYESVREHPKLYERIKYTREAIIDEALLASLWNVKTVIVAGAGENTANENQTDALAYIWGKSAWVGYIEPRPRLKRPSWGYHMQSQKLLVERWRDNPRKGEMFRVSFKEVPKVVTPSAGYFIQTVVS
jgi:hypothetical protein